MISRVQFARSDVDFASMTAEVSATLNTSLRLPQLPFVEEDGQVLIGQYERLLGGGFARVLEALASTYGDEYISFITIDPVPDYYRINYGFLPAFRIAPDALAEGYWAGLSFEPKDDPTGAIAYTANVVGVVGSTRVWSVWGQRDWDLLLVHLPTIDGAWMDAGVPFLGAVEALEFFTTPTRWATPLTESEASRFLENMRAHGSQA